MADRLYFIGRAMQVVGMILLPLAMAGNLAPESPQSVATMMWMCGIGVAVFIVGHAIQQYAKPSE